MFIGHYAVALAAKRVAPRVSLGTTLCAAEFLDLVWPVLLLLGVEHFRIAPGSTAVTPLDFFDYPYSHSLVFAIGWSGFFGGVHFILKRDRRAALVLGAVVLSHWVCDFVVHRPDMPVLMTTGYTDSANSLLAMGIRRTLAKPCPSKTLLAAVRQALGLPEPAAVA